MMSQWMMPVKASGQAFIVPSQASVTFLGAASEAWTAMLVDLVDLAGVNGNATSVGAAVSFANQYLKDYPPVPLPRNYVRPTWKVVGDANVTFKGSQ
jgi:hypothetical protein